MVTLLALERLETLLSSVMKTPWFCEFSDVDMDELPDEDELESLVPLIGRFADCWWMWMAMVGASDGTVDMEGDPEFSGRSVSN